VICGGVLEPAEAYDLTEDLTLETAATAVVQYGAFDDAGIGDTGRATTVVDIGLDWQPTPADEFNLIVSVAKGNALNQVSPLSLVPFADDLEADLEDINNRDWRDYLLTAWYRREFVFTDEVALGLTGGIIDSTDYLDDNAYANDEVTQFMNDIFVNNTLANLPSYDFGAVAELDAYQNWSLRFVWMNSRTENEDPVTGGVFEEAFNYFGGQIGHHAETPLGAGNYRVLAFATDDNFIGPQSGEFEALRGVGLSLDQEIGERLGLFARFGWQDDDGPVDHDLMGSIGVRLSGAFWGRPQDEAGLAYARLAGADTAELDNTDVLEAYVKIALAEWSDLSFDLQYVGDDLEDGDGPSAFIPGARLNVFF